MNIERFVEPTVSRRDVMVLGSRLIALASVLALGGCGLGGPAYQAVPPEVDVVVEMTNWMRFSPARVTLRAGEVIEWRNRSLFAHTATADPRLAKDPKHVELPQGAPPFDSGVVPAGGTYRAVFDVPGTYRYFCIPHEAWGMVGTIEVEPAG